MNNNADMALHRQTQLEKALTDVVDAWESLPGGQEHPTWKVERWLGGPMKTSIARARKVLGRKPPEGD